MAVLKIRARGVNHDDAVWENTYFLKTNRDVLTSDQADVLADVREYLERMYTTIAGIVYITVDAVEFIVNVIDLVSGLEQFFVGGVWTFSGLEASQALPTHDAMKIRFPAAGFQRGKSLAIPGISENDNFQGTLTAAAIADLINFGAQFLIPPTSAGTLTYTPTLWRPTTLTTADFLSTAIIDSRIRTQATRSTGRGE